MINKRRISVYEELNLADIYEHIYGEIYLLKTSKSVQSYFTETQILNALNDKLGWPVKSDKYAMKLFKQIFKKCTEKYMPYYEVRGGYSFKLKLNPVDTFVARILKRSEI
jgi:hypothetical protein